MNNVPEGTPFKANFAFTATVTGVSTDPDEQALAAGEGDGSFWRVELLVARVHRGHVPSGPIAWTGHTLRHLSCNNDLLGEQLHVGERLFVALDDRFELGISPQPAGRLLLWQRVGDSWEFHAAALIEDENAQGGPYPRAAKDATTTREILAAIFGSMPDTATEPTTGQDDRAGSETGRLAFFVIALAVSVLLAVGWISRRARVIPNG